VESVFLLKNQCIFVPQDRNDDSDRVPFGLSDSPPVALTEGICKQVADWIK
jgi:hypothetical protein